VTAAYTCSHRPFPLTICRSVSVQCIEKNRHRIRIPFGMVSRMGPGIRQVTGFGDRSTGRGNLGGKYGVPHCNQWGLCGVAVRKCVNHQSCSLDWCVGWAESLLCNGKGRFWSFLFPHFLCRRCCKVYFYNSTALGVGQLCRLSAHAEFLELQARRAGLGLECGVATTPSNVALFTLLWADLLKITNLYTDLSQCNTFL